MKKIILIAVAMVTGLFAQQNTPQNGKRTPPPEAISACSGKTVNSSCSITTPEGKTIEGQCRNTPDGQYFACIPNNHRPQGQ